jgi:hypothetical protein
MDILEQIRANADLVVKQNASLKEGGFGYDEASVKWLDGYIGRLSASGEFSDAEKRSKIVSVFGSYLGECIIKSFGGTWSQRDGNWCIAFDEENCAFPFAKVEKRFLNGEEDSIASFYGTIPVIFSLAKKAGSRPWWRFWR